MSRFENQEPAAAGAAIDAELRRWLGESTDEACDVIVEAALPPRRVAFQQAPGGRKVPNAIDAADSQQRESMLHELDGRLRGLAGVEETRVLKSAGAIAVRATAGAIKTIANQPQVKAIRINRRLK